MLKIALKEQNTEQHFYIPEQSYTRPSFEKMKTVLSFLSRKIEDDCIQVEFVLDKTSGLGSVVRLQVPGKGWDVLWRSVQVIMWS